ncbi:type II secretion system F family protein [Thermodesulfobacteriota bacterium]
MAISLNQPAPTLAPKIEIKPKNVSKGPGINLFGSPVKGQDVIFFSSQLSLMLEIGTPLKSALETLGKQMENEVFKDIIKSMVKDIEAGRQLSDAMQKHPKVFDSIYSSMVRAGETGGFLKEILDRIVELKEKRQALKSQLKSTLTYPAVLCVVASLVVVFILTFVLPKFASVFAGKESVLPFTTRFMFSLSDSLRAYWWVYIISATGLLIGFKLFKDSETGGLLTDRTIISLPLVAKLANTIFTCQFLRTLGNLLESHVPLLEALKVTRGTINNHYFREFLDRIVEHVKEGGKFSQPFADYAYTLESVKQMVATGEEAGNLPKVMLRLAEFYDIEVERDLKSFAAMIEPLALIILGGVIGLIVSSVILPLFKLASTVH